MRGQSLRAVRSAQDCTRRSECSSQAKPLWIPEGIRAVFFVLCAASIFVAGCKGLKSKHNGKAQEPVARAKTPPARTASPFDPLPEGQAQLALWSKLAPSELSAACPSSSGWKEQSGVLITPKRPVAQQKLEILVADWRAESVPNLRLQSAAGESIAFSGRGRSGLPAIAQIQLDAGLAAGRYRLVIAQGDQILGCQDFRVAKRARPQPRPTSIDRERMWRPRRGWNGGEEALYSAWIKILFDGPTDEDLAWKALHEVTQDKSRNILHNYLGWGEDDQNAMKLTPDCADVPYFMRAYFAWKRGLPFMFHRCDRGTDKRAPRCRITQSSDDSPVLRSRWIPDKAAKVAYQKALKKSHREGKAPPKFAGSLSVEDPREVMEYFFSRTVAWGVHTGNGRVAWEDERNDFYPVALARDSLRPGMMYADPYGHILMLVDLRPGSPGAPGVLFAVDGQPDASITRKRFWQGNFLWNPDPKLGGSGFKAFRPVVRDKKANELRVTGDNFIGGQKGLAQRAQNLARFDKTSFYDHMESLITPGTRHPILSLRQLVDALAEAARIRVRSVQNGVDWEADNAGKLIEMPQGYKLFETTGAWENYSTPARDLRLLIAMDAVLDFPDKVGRQPKAFGVKEDKRSEAVAAVREELNTLLSDPRYEFSYLRSDGQEQKLRLQDLVDRVQGFEMAYNPNDCPEIRWAALPQSAELQSCTRRAPQAQRERMELYRPWFQGRRRPARGEERPGETM